MLSVMDVIKLIAARQLRCQRSCWPSLTTNDMNRLLAMLGVGDLKTAQVYHTLDYTLGYVEGLGHH